MDDRKTEREFYRQLVGHARRVRERAAESLRRSGALDKRQGGVGSQPDAAPNNEGFDARDDSKGDRCCLRVLI